MVMEVSVIETFSSTVLYPLLRVQQVAIEPIAHWIGRSVTIRELEKTVEMLQKKHDEIFAENIALKAMHCYAEETSELRDFKKRYMLNKGHTAQVLARHFSENSHFFLVDAGASHGIKKDMVAIYCNAIVGRVTQVYPWYSKVCLITDVDCKVASVCSKKGATGIHEGINDIRYTVIRYMSHLEAVDINDVVFSSGDGLVFPKGFALGNIVSADKGDLFYTIVVRPIVDFQTLHYCMLIAKENI